MSNNTVEKMNRDKIKLKFSVFADVEYNGFVIDIYHTVQEAKIIMNKIWELGNPPSPFSLQDLVAIFHYMSFKHYELDEEHLFYEKALTDQSNGFYTVGIVELNENFTFEDYLKSRKSSK